MHPRRAREPAAAAPATVIARVVYRQLMSRIEPPRPSGGRRIHRAPRAGRDVTGYAATAGRSGGFSERFAASLRANASRALTARSPVKLADTDSAAFVTAATMYVVALPPLARRRDFVRPRLEREQRALERGKHIPGGLGDGRHDERLDRLEPFHHRRNRHAVVFDDALAAWRSRTFPIGQFFRFRQRRRLRKVDVDPASCSPHSGLHRLRRRDSRPQRARLSRRPPRQSRRTGAAPHPRAPSTRPPPRATRPARPRSRARCAPSVLRRDVTRLLRQFDDDGEAARAGNQQHVCGGAHERRAVMPGGPANAFVNEHASLEAALRQESLRARRLRRGRHTGRPPPGTSASLRRVNAGIPAAAMRAAIVRAWGSPGQLRHGDGEPGAGRNRPGRRRPEQVRSQSTAPAPTTPTSATEANRLGVSTAPRREKGDRRR